MELNDNGMPKCVIGTKYSHSTLKSMTKDELIELLGIAQHNYECVNESEFNIKQYAEKLDKALDEACEKLDDLSYESKMYYDGYYQTKEEWKTEFLTEVGIE